MSSSSSFDPTALGFLPGKEVKQAGVGNLGLQDRESTALWLGPVRLCVRRTPRLEVGTDVHLRVRWRPFKSDNVSDNFWCRAWTPSTEPRAAGERAQVPSRCRYTC